MRRGASAVRRRTRRDAPNLLDVAPIRVADWVTDGERLVVIRPRPRSRGLLLPLDWLAYFMAVRRIRLDEVGTAAWRLFDGARTVGEVAELVRDQFGDAVEPAEQRLGHLVRLLHRERLVCYRALDPLPPPGSEGQELPPERPR